MNPDHTPVAAVAQRLLDTGRLHEVLRLLNDRVPHRFTGVYRFDPPTLRNVGLFDSANPYIEVGADAPLRETYCSLVGETESTFHTGDADADPRLVEHPARGGTIAYCGTPLWTGEGGRAFGTLCHFDVVPRPVPREEIPVLEAVARLIARHLNEDGGGDVAD